jgi:hypothetical protein
VKPKHCNKRTHTLGFWQNRWVRVLLAKRTKPVPRITRKRYRKAKALAAANRRACATLAIAAVVTAGLFGMVLSVPPRISPEQLAANVKAMRVHKLADSSFNASESPGVVAPSAQATTRDEAEVSSLKDRASAKHPRPQYPLVSFERLSAFRFFVTDQMVDNRSGYLTASANCLEQIPQDVLALNDKDVSLTGFMLPMKYEGKLTTEFLLLKNQSLCCYGKPPRITEWVNVRMAGKGIKALMNEPVTVCGIFHVGEVRQNGELLGVYRLDADKVKGPRE